MPTRFWLVTLLFLVSGATGLLYEVAFSKLLAYVFGATAYAVSTVLAAFMGGLALGAHLGGKYAARSSRPLVVYGALETLVGLICAVTPFLIDALTATYVHIARTLPDSLALLTLARAVFTALLIVLPTIAMGATLPVLSRIVAGNSEHAAGRRLTGLYAVNTTGGALGALLSAYLVLPALGVHWTLWTAALVNAAIGAIAILTGLRSARIPVTKESSQATSPTVPHTQPERLFIALAFVSGFLVFAAEVVETHLLALLIGNSAYAFGLMLAIFLVCLGVGAARASVFASRHGSNALWRGLVITALCIAITLPLWDQLPNIFAFAGKFVHSWAGRELCRALAALVILVLPTFWMGITFPLLLQRIAHRPDVSAQVGKLSFANTLGTILGSIATGYFILPALGSQYALAAIATAFALAAILAANPQRKQTLAQLRWPVALAAVAIAVAFLMPRWDLARLTSGANVYFGMRSTSEQVDFIREDVHGGVTTVARANGVTTMYTNGKFQGDDGFEMTAQRRFAHFPSLFVRHPDRALVIGLGTGTTLGTVATYPYQHIEVAEISPAIVEAAQRYFSNHNGDALADPRVDLLLNDGRNALLVTNHRYDLVTIELSSIWFAGASNLYSAQFYELVRSRLTSDGVLQQWVQLHHIRPRELGVIIRTLRSVFPHVALFVGGAQGILVASQKPLVASSAHLDELQNLPRLQATLNGTPLVNLLDDLVTSGPELDRFIDDAAKDGGPIVSTDDNLYLEYTTPRGNVLDYRQSIDHILTLLEQYRTPDVRQRHLEP